MQEGQKTPEERVAKLHQRLITDMPHMLASNNQKGIKYLSSNENSQPNLAQIANMTHSSSGSK